MINQNIINEFKENGVVCIREAITKDWLECLNIGVSNVIENPEKYCAICDIPSDTGKFFNGFFSSLAEPNIARFIRESPIKNDVKQLMNSTKIRLFYDQLLAKFPNTSQRTPWHSDRDYFPLQGEQIVSVWIPLDPVDQKNGTMSFIKGSHLKPITYYVEQCPIKESIDDDKGMYVLPDFEEFPDLFEIVSWDLNPGDILIFHIDILHYAGANLSSKENRRALSVRLLGEDVSISETKTHILDKEEVLEFLEKMGKPWLKTLDEKLFPFL